MSEHGFESNEDYSYPLRCLLNAPTQQIRCLNICGDNGRRKTAFGNALASSLNYPHLFYHDFSVTDTPPPIVYQPDQNAEKTEQQPPISALDRILSDTCAFSEAEKTVLILDQLHCADFQQQLRLHRFVIEQRWHYANAEFYANAKQLLLFFISEEPLYHSLQKVSFNLWINPNAVGEQPYQPRDFSLPDSASDFIQTLNGLFEQLNCCPTESEYRHLLHDIHVNIKTCKELSQSIFGWLEGIDQQQLQQPKIEQTITTALRQIETYLDIDSVEIS